MILLNRNDIYKRFKVINQLHTGDKQHNQSNCFAVTREFYPNIDNLMKGDLNGSVVVKPEFFYSQKWLESGFKQSKIISDFPLVLLTPGERRFNGVDKKVSTFTFELIVFDLMFYDRNNKTGNETATRELEEIWQDTERIMIEILCAYMNHDLNKLYNLAIAACYDNTLPENPADWNEGQTAQAISFLKCNYLHNQNFTLRLTGDSTPFEYKGTKRLAGTSIEFETDLFTGCVDGSFNENFCV